MGKINFASINEKEPDRITKVKLKKYEEEVFAESGYRVVLDGEDTKYCWCAICDTYFSADSNHTLGNIRSHFNGHKNRKRGPKVTMDNFVTKKTKISISPDEIAEYRKLATQSLCMAGQPNSYFESNGAKLLFDSLQRKFINLYGIIYTV